VDEEDPAAGDIIAPFASISSRAEINSLDSVELSLTHFLAGRTPRPPVICFAEAARGIRISTASRVATIRVRRQPLNSLDSLL
jgi:hypothetical protein